MNEDIKNLSFEESLNELENIIKKMESGNIKLSDSVAFYERGIQLKNHCEDLLQNAKLKIEKIQLTPIENGKDKIEISDLEIK